MKRIKTSPVGKTIWQFALIPVCLQFIPDFQRTKVRTQTLRSKVNTTGAITSWYKSTFVSFCSLRFMQECNTSCRVILHT